MRIKNIAYTMIFVLLSEFLIAESHCFFPMLNINSAIHSVQSTQNDYPVKAQGSVFASAGIGFLLADHFWLGVFGGAHFVAESGKDGGFYYRGYSGQQIGMDLGYTHPLTILPNLFDTYLGFTFGASAFLSQYIYTYLYFFYPEISIKPFILMLPHKEQFWAVRAGLPAAWQFRQDTASFSIGIEISIMLRIQKSFNIDPMLSIPMDF